MTSRRVRRRRVVNEADWPTEALRPQATFLANLPAEIIDNVAPFVYSERDLAALAVTSRRMHQILNRRLYQMNDGNSPEIWREHTRKILNDKAVYDSLDEIVELESQLYDGHALLWAVRENRPETLMAMQAMGIKTDRFGALQSAARSGLMAVVKVLLKDPTCRINSQDFYFDLKDARLFPWPISALHAAASSHRVAIVRLLLDRGAEVNSVAQHYLHGTPLHIATEENNAYMVSFLLGRRADPTIKNASGQTALHTAAKRNYHSIMQLLLGHGASLGLVDNDDRTALDLAIASGAGDCVKVLLRHGALERGQSQGAFFDALDRGRFRVAEAIFQHFPGIQFDRVDEQGNGLYALIVAVTGDTTGMYALRSLLGTLLKKGAEIDAEDTYGRTALHHACMLRRGVPATFLVRKGADLMTPDRDGKTPLGIAMEYHYDQGSWHPDMSLRSLFEFD
ncbi:hypothetical protein PLICBS_004989 [Purpureocillium lilacinum]|uniref:uncharacterized protein n=1 Tax=Purpureocillium lilacinum TaxID=33203 RepID=UPI00208D18B0|nr:hypothetical protein PLICBS_004989 [Purpureocillium lilacinum]